MGCVAGYRGNTSLRVRPHVVFHLPVCPMVAPYLHGIHLLDQRLVEYERDLAQPHSQSLFYLENIEPAVQHHVVRDTGDLPDLL